MTDECDAAGGGLSTPRRGVLTHEKSVRRPPARGTAASHEWTRAGTGSDGWPGPTCPSRLRPVIKYLGSKRVLLPRILDEVDGLARRAAGAGAPIRTVLFHPRFPVDIRHNAKIGREALAVWASRQLS